MKQHTERMGNPTPIGLIGLALGCAVLAPQQLGLTNGADAAIWIWMLLGAGALQVYAGVIDLINRNVLGATAFTVYGTLWIASAWFRAHDGTAGDPLVLAYVNFTFMLISAVILIGFMTVSLNLTIVLVEFVTIFAVEVLATAFPALNLPVHNIVGTLLIMAAFQVLWAAAGGIINGLLGREIFWQGTPPLRPPHAREPAAYRERRHHMQLRERILGVMYDYWEHHGWEWLSTHTVCEQLGMPPEALAPDFWYLFQKGHVAVDEDRLKADPEGPKWVRITASGVDYHDELQLSHFKF